VLLLLAGMFLGYRLNAGPGGGAQPNHEGEVLSVSGTADPFDRPDDPSSLGAVPEGPPWRAEAGTWGVVAGQAAVTTPAQGHSLAVVPLGGGDGTVQVRLAKVVNGAGIVFRYQDPLNYWAVVAVPYYATWAVSKTVGGHTSGMGSTGLSAVQDGTTVAVRLVGGTIDVAVEGQVRRTVADADLRRAPSVGMVAPAGTGASDARFDDFHLALPGDRALPAPVAAESSTTKPSEVTTPSTVAGVTSATTAPATPPVAPVVTLGPPVPSTPAPPPPTTVPVPVPTLAVPPTTRRAGRAVRSSPLFQR